MECTVLGEFALLEGVPEEKVSVGFVNKNSKSYNSVEEHNNCRQCHFFFPFFFFFDTFIKGLEGRLTSAEFIFYNRYAGMSLG